MTPQEFYAQYSPFAQKVSERTGLDPRLVLAQAALETGYGKSAPGGNFFGIKSHGREGGNTLQTKEFQGGEMVSQPASFRAYDNAGQSFDDYADFLVSNPRYKDVLAAGDLEGQIDAIGKSGYATDPRYAAKLRNIAAKFDPSLPDTIAADTMTALGKGPRGILAAPEPEAQPMIAKQQPQGLLGSLGIQKMQPGAEGETGQRFYERDTFKDTAARLSQGFAALGGNPAVQKFASDVAAQRTEGKARNKTVGYLRKAGRTDLADMVEKGLISGRDAAGAIMQQPKDDRTSLMKNYEFYIGKGMSPEEAMQAVKSGTSVTIGQKGADQFDKSDATTLSEVSQAGMSAARSLTQIDRLETLLSNVDTGMAASIKDMAGNFGINTEGLDDIQAAKALINNLVPQQRAPGSGPMSDKDLEIFKQSLPRLINQPGGNEIILQTMRGIAQYDAAGFDIVQKYRSGEIDKQQAFAELRNRPDPFAGIRLGAGAPVEMDRGRALELLTGEGN
jgi:flagellar protein FlgJ